MSIFGALARAVFGSSNDRYVKSLRPLVLKINDLEPQVAALSDAALAARTQEFRTRLTQGETLDSLLPEAFATVREAAKRALGQRHYDVQMIGGIVLHRGEIAEMRTGEGKTLVGTLPVYLNALKGEGVHVITVNDYLARRDSEWMGQVYRFLGLSVGVVVHGIDDNTRRAAYACDITYGANNEFGFDYLRDNMKYALEQMVQRPFSYALVDEVDSILIDEARTPLIISGPTENRSEQYQQVNAVVREIKPEHYDHDEKQRSIILTEDGVEHMEKMLRAAGLLKSDNLYDLENTQIVHHVNQALRAIFQYKRDTDYIVKGGKVIIIDEFTGRMMEGRRWSEGLHQAVEAKEGVEIQPENQTMASITFQNYFRMYPKLGGMTGTAATEAPEFYDIYRLNVVEIPTHKPVQRIDSDDEFYRTAEEKFAAITVAIREAQAKGQPVLVGTVSIEKSELLAQYLTREKVEHKVLNARFHEQEARIVAQAGRRGMVTIATNMAGRGTDIQLGGNADYRINDELASLPEGEERTREIERIRTEVADEREAVKQAGGLFVLGTERHESRRIDNQLRGRAGRQGDPGFSRFYLSLQDDLLRIFGPQTRMDAMLVKLGLQEGEAIVHPWINKAIEKAQQKVEARNYDVRKQLLQYDDVMNDQRKVVYEQRREVMDSTTVSDVVTDMRADTINIMVADTCPLGSYPERWRVGDLVRDSEDYLGLGVEAAEWVREEGMDPVLLEERLAAAAQASMSEKEARIGAEAWARVEKNILLQALDQRWKEHLATLDALRQVIHLRAYAQRNPLNEYKSEAFTLFEAMLTGVRQEVTRVTMRADFRVPPALPAQGPLMATHVDPLTGQNEMDMSALEQAFGLMGGEGPGMQSAVSLPPLTPSQIAHAATLSATMDSGYDPADPLTWRVARNAPCPCGSGPKFKHCHGRVGGDVMAALAG